MEKKFYVTPEMEEMSIKIETGMLEVSVGVGGGDPSINPVELDPEEVVTD